MCLGGSAAPTWQPPPKVEKEADPNAIYELGSGKKIGEQTDKDKLKVDTISNPGPQAAAQSSKTDKAY